MYRSFRMFYCILRSRTSAGFATNSIMVRVRVRVRTSVGFATNSVLTLSRSSRGDVLGLGLWNDSRRNRPHGHGYSQGNADATVMGTVRVMQMPWVQSG